MTVSIGWSGTPPTTARGDTGYTKFHGFESSQQPAVNAPDVRSHSSCDVYGRLLALAWMYPANTASTVERTPRSRDPHCRAQRPNGLVCESRLVRVFCLASAPARRLNSTKVDRRKTAACQVPPSGPGDGAHAGSYWSDRPCCRLIELSTCASGLVDNHVGSFVQTMGLGSPLWRSK